MKVSRSIFVAAAAFVAAACGDKVVVQGPSSTNTAQTVVGVTVSPANVAMTIGQSVTFTAIVDVTNGAAQTVTWTPTSGAVSVSSAGVATANSATAGVAVCATSTVDATKKGCAQATVSATAPVVPATVSIQSITVNGTNNVSVNPAAVAGTIDVRVNVSPGNETVTKIVLLVGTVRADSQTFTAAQSAALRFAADEALANQSAFPPILFSVNTAAITNTATGAVRFANGNYVISVQLYTSASATTPRATATYHTPLTFVNVDGWLATVSGSTNNSLNAGGFRYDRGPLTVAVVPVSYSGGAMASGSVSFGSACDASAPAFGTVRTTALVAPAAGTSAWTATFSNTATAAVTNVTNYEFDAGLCALNAIGEQPTVTGVNAAGDALFAAAAPLNASAVTGIRLDNRAPLVPSLIQNPNSRQASWVNAAIGFTTVNTGATSNGMYVNPGTQAGCSAPARLDCGVGTTVRMGRIAASAAGTQAEARAATPSATPALPAPSVTSSAYCLIVTMQDALGNEAAFAGAATSACTPATAPAAGSFIALAANHMLLGVDIAAPTIAYTAASMPANSRRSAGTIAGEFVVVVNDTGLVGNSGMLQTPVGTVLSPVGMRVEARRAGAVPNSAGTITCNDATGPTVPTVIGCTTLATTGQTSLGAGAWSTTMTGTTGGANHAYYTHFATGTDAAGNSASVTPRVVVYDAAPPLAGTPSAPVSITASNFSASAFISDDLDIQDYSFGANYGAVAPFSPAAAILQMPMVGVNGFNAATFINTNFGVTASVPLPLALQANVAAGLTNLASLATLARAQSNLPGVSAGFVPGLVTPGAAISTTNFTTFPAVTLPAGVAGTVTGNTTAATAANPANVLLTATITGTTAVFNNPFSRMDFYMLDAPGLRYFLVGTAGVATLNDNGATRTFTFTATINGATVYSLLGGAGATWASNIVAVGVGAANGNVAMVAAANTALNVVF